MDDDSSRKAADERVALREAHSRMLGLAFERERQNEVLRESEERFRAAFDFAAIGMALVAPDGRFMQVNHALCQMLGYDADELLSRTFHDITHPDDLDADLALVQQLLDGEIETYNLEKRYIHRDGYVVWTLLTVALVRDRRGHPLHFISQIQDITGEKTASIALQKSEARLARILETIDNPIVIFNAEGRLVMANEETEVLLEVDRAREIGRSYHDLIWKMCRPDGSPLPVEERPVARVIRTREPVRAVEIRFDVAGREIHGLVNATPLLNEYGEFEGVVSIMHEITRQKQLERDLAHRAMHDPLTGLPNRVLFLDRVQQGLASARRSGQCVAVLYVDLDNFKHVNDTWGHAAGDDLLMQIAERLEMDLREEDTAARIGGDELAVLLRGVAPTADLTEVAQRLLRRLSEPMHLEAAGRSIRTTPSIGIALSNGADDDPPDLLRRADAAMYQAKRAGKHTVVIYDAAIEDVAH